MPHEKGSTVMNTLRKEVRVFQWIAPVVMPLWFLIAAGSGWQFLGMMMLSPFVFLALLVAPIMTAASKRVRATRSVPPRYAALTLALWIVAILPPLSLQHSSDLSTGPSLLQNLGLSETANSVVSTVSWSAVVLLWIAVVLSLIVEMPKLPAPVPVVTSVPLSRVS